MKKKKRLIIIIVIIVAVLAVIIFIPKGNNDSTIAVKNITLKAGDLQSTISSTGVVQSTDSKNVYSSLTYPVKSINVKVGDIVKDGDILCQLDTTTVEQSITTAKSALNGNKTNSDYTLTKGQRDYLTLKQEISDGTETGIFNATKSVESAKIVLDKAQENYDDKLKNIEKKTDTTLKNAENAVKTAQSAATLAEVQLNSALSGESEKSVKDLFIGVISTRKLYEQYKTDLRRSQYEENIETFAIAVDGKSYYGSYTALMSAYSQLDTANLNYENALSGIDDSIKSLKDNLKSAQTAYDNAVTSLENAKNTANKTLETYKSSFDNSKATVDFTAQVLQLENLEKDLVNCTVKSPISGTVTAVYANEGSAPTGVMFVVEDTGSLKIKAKIKEYDITNIAKDMKVIIKSDATGDEEYEGYISKIAPTAIKDNVSAAAGSTGGTSVDTQFEYDVTVTSTNTKLLIGMSTRLNIIAAQKDNIFSVRYDALVTDKDGKSVVYVAKDNGNGKYKVETVPVKTGLETDLDVEISGEGLKDGTIIITDTDKVKAGSIVSLSK